MTEGKIPERKTVIQTPETRISGIIYGKGGVSELEGDGDIKAREYLEEIIEGV